MVYRTRLDLLGVLISAVELKKIIRFVVKGIYMYVLVYFL